jgi:DNA-binding NarL/FixJ family response regulator
VETFTPDLIFVDIRLPGENGLELTRKIRGRDRSVPIIILTSYDLPEYREAAKEYQANHFLSKGSVNRENILTLVQSVFSGQNINLDH